MNLHVIQKSVLCAVLPCLISLKSLARIVESFPPPANPPMLQAIKASGRITIDGILNESSWQQTPVTSDFFRMEPRQGSNYLYQTFVRILFDERNIYFGVFCKDTLGRKGIRVQDYRRDFSYGENDVFYLQLDPQNLKRFCVSFQTTPIGTQRDLQVFDEVLKITIGMRYGKCEHPLQIVVITRNLLYHSNHCVMIDP